MIYNPSSNLFIPVLPCVRRLSRAREREREGKQGIQRVDFQGEGGSGGTIRLTGQEQKQRGPVPTPPALHRREPTGRPSAATSDELSRSLHEIRHPELLNLLFIKDLLPAAGPHRRRLLRRRLLLSPFALRMGRSDVRSEAPPFAVRIPAIRRRGPAGRWTHRRGNGRHLRRRGRRRDWRVRLSRGSPATEAGGFIVG